MAWQASGYCACQAARGRRCLLCRCSSSVGCNHIVTFCALYFCPLHVWSLHVCSLHGCSLRVWSPHVWSLRFWPLALWMRPFAACLVASVPACCVLCPLEGAGGLL